MTATRTNRRIGSIRSTFGPRRVTGIDIAGSYLASFHRIKLMRWTGLRTTFCGTWATLSREKQSGNGSARLLDKSNLARRAHLLAFWQRQWMLATSTSSCFRGCTTIYDPRHKFASTKGLSALQTMTGRGKTSVLATYRAKTPRWTSVAQPY